MTWDGWDSLVLLTSSDTWYPVFAERVSIPIVAIVKHKERAPKLTRNTDTLVRLPFTVTGIEELLTLSTTLAITQGTLAFGDHVIFLGMGHKNDARFIVLSQITEPSFKELYTIITDTAMPDPGVLNEVLLLALELSRMRKRPAGALYVIGDAERVLNNSVQLFINPFEGQPVAKRQLSNRLVRRTLQEYARLDGAVVIDERGVVHAAGVHVNADTRCINVPMEGTRHAIAAAITHETSAVAVVASEKTGAVALFKAGKAVLKVKP
jgi:DNA integrity scanning protein DisA with diadenylate cyclase activity